MAASLLTRLMIPRWSMSAASPARALSVATAAIAHAMLVRPRQTSNPRLIPTDAAVMMYGSANASFGREVRRVSRGIRTANNDGTVCFRRKLYNAIDYQNRNVH